MNAQDANDIVQALRGGLVPRRGLHHLATGMDSVMRAVDQELDFVATGKGTAKWIRGEYGSGKTFATRLLCARARDREGRRRHRRLGTAARHQHGGHHRHRCHCSPHVPCTSWGMRASVTRH